MFNGIPDFSKIIIYLFMVCLALAPLAIWKLIEILIYVWSHLH